MIYVVSHKNTSIPDVQGLQGIQVGSMAEDIPGFLRDNTGCHISEKNPNYCELTALFWIWKNTEEPYAGLAHYRRFFGRKRMSSRTGDIYPESALRKMLDDGTDIILAEPVHYHVDARKQLLRSSALPETFEALRAEIDTREPDCLSSFDRFFAGNKASLYNMFYCRREVLEEYCSWLFPILFALEPKLDTEMMNGYQKRVYGFLAERLLNIWVIWKGLKVKTVPVIQTEYTWKQQLLYSRRDVTNRIRFALSGGHRCKGV